MKSFETILTEHDFIVVVDASGSMETEDMSGGRSRWAAMQESVVQMVRDVTKLDADGIGLVVFSGTSVDSFDNVDVNKLTEVFSTRKPRSSTPLAEALTAALKLAGKSDKKDFIIVFTDGVPDNEAAAAKVIREAANKQETDDALTILFVQVGYDTGAAKYLEKLDEQLTGCKFDIVDTKTMAQAEKFDSVAELIAAAIAD